MVKRDVLYQRIEDARRRQKQTGELAWLLGFLRRDLTSPLREGERRDLSDDVLAFIEADYEGLAAAELTQHDLHRIQRSTAEGLDALFQRGRWDLGEHFGTVHLTFESDSDGPPASSLHNDLVYRPWGRLRRRYYVHAAGRASQERPSAIERSFVVAASHKIEAAGDRLRRCLWCASFFIPVRRQRFCSKLCTQEAMNARRPGRERLPKYSAVSGPRRRQKTRTVLRAGGPQAVSPRGRPIVKSR